MFVPDTDSQEEEEELLLIYYLKVTYVFYLNSF